MPFKNPIWTGLDAKMDERTLDEIILALEAIGYHVCLTVCDQGGSNIGFLNRKGITVEKPYFKNPFDSSRRVYMMYDVPHLIKSCRNHLIDQGYRFPSGETLRKADLLKLLEMKHQLRCNYKMTLGHLECKKSMRQDVLLAAQVLSRSTAGMLERTRSDKPDSVRFLRRINDFFDVMNSRSKTDDNPLRGAYGTLLDKQEKVLTEMQEEIGKIRKIGAKADAALLPFQHGIQLACAGMKSFYWYMRERYQLPYIMTSRCNQDFVENEFSRLRAYGHDHPNATEALDRLRLLMIAADSGVVVHGASVRMERDVEVTQDWSESEPVVESLARQIMNDDGEDEGEQSDGGGADVIEGEVLQAPPPAELTKACDEVLRDPDYEALLAHLDPDEDDDSEDDELSDDEGEQDGESVEDMDVDLTPPPPAPEPTSQFDSVDQALKFVAGWLAWCFQDKYHDQLTYGPTGQLPPEFLEDFPWLTTISRGGLLVPTLEFVEVLRLMEKDFDEFHSKHPHRIDLEKGVFDRMADILYSKYEEEVPREVILKYTRFRTFVLLKWLNHKLAEEKAKKKTAKTREGGGWGARRNARKVGHYTN